MKGKVYNTDEGWVVTYRYDHGKGYQTYELPVNPQDVKNLNPLIDDGKNVNFEILTIAHGSSEFDVMDMDVAKIIF